MMGSMHCCELCANGWIGSAAEKNTLRSILSFRCPKNNKSYDNYDQHLCQ